MLRIILKIGASLRKGITELDVCFRKKTLGQYKEETGSSEDRRQKTFGKGVTRPWREATVV